MASPSECNLGIMRFCSANRKRSREIKGFTVCPLQYPPSISTCCLDNLVVVIRDYRQVTIPCGVLIIFS